MPRNCPIMRSTMSFLWGLRTVNWGLRKTCIKVPPYEYAALWVGIQTSRKCPSSYVFSCVCRLWCMLPADPKDIRSRIEQGSYKFLSNKSLSQCQRCIDRYRQQRRIDSCRNSWVTFSILNTKSWRYACILWYPLVVLYWLIIWACLNSICLLEESTPGLEVRSITRSTACIPGLSSLSTILLLLLSSLPKGHLRESWRNELNLIQPPLTAL